MKPFQARVKYAVGPPREFMGKLKINLALVAIEEHVMAGYTRLTGKDLIRINAVAETEEHEHLKQYRVGETVMLVKAGDYEGKPYFKVLEMPMPAQNGAPVQVKGGAVDAQVVRIGAELMAACYANILVAFHGHGSLPNDETLGKMAISLFIHLTDNR